MLNLLDAFVHGDLAWRASVWLWLLLLPVLVWGLKKAYTRQHKQQFADAQLWPWVMVTAETSSAQATTTAGQSWWRHLGAWFKKRLTPALLLALAWWCFVIALAGPQVLKSEQPMQNRAGVDVLVSMDVSRSMLAQDVAPERLQQAKNLAQSLAMDLSAEDRIGLSVFAGHAHNVSPLSADKSLFTQALKLIQPGIVPTQGSWLELALIKHLHFLEQTARNGKVLVMFSDGAAPFWQAPKMPNIIANLPTATQQSWAKTGTKVIIVGMGTAAGAPIPDASHSSGTLHANGLRVTARLQSGSLQQLAQQAQGVYLQGNQSASFQQKLQATIMQAAQNQPQTQLQAVWQHYAQGFIWVGLISLLLAFYGAIFNVRKGELQGSKLPIFIGSVFVGLSQFMLWGTLSFLPGQVWAQPEAGTEAQRPAHNKIFAKRLTQAHQAYRARDYAQAKTYYAAVPTYSGWFGAGSAAYKEGDLEAAVAYFRQAAWLAWQDRERATALFNLGNSYFQAKLFAPAVESYQQALRYQASYPKARHNLALAQARLKQQTQQQQQQPDEQKGEEEDGKGDQGGDNDGAFYGGQKPNSDNEEPGFGTDGDSDEGNKNGEQVNLPQAEPLTDLNVNPAIRVLQLQQADTGKALSGREKVLKSEQMRRNAQQLAQQLQDLQDDQQGLLKKRFEREQGFEASQTEPVSIPGVQPW